MLNGGLVVEFCYGDKEYALKPPVIKYTRGGGAENGTKMGNSGRRISQEKLQTRQSPHT
jgi:hypothetical protein